MPIQTGVLTARFSAIPLANNIDSVIGFSKGPVDAFSGMGMIVRFSSTGSVDVRNAGTYQAETVIDYEANKKYHFRVEMNLDTFRYSVFVAPEGSAEVSLGNNYEFREEQKTLSLIDNIAFYSAENGGVLVSDIVFGNDLPDTSKPIITLSGGSTLNIILGSTFTDPGAMAFDNIDGDISNAIQVGGDTVDTSKEGMYNITYNVSDEAGNSAHEVKRIVKVSEKRMPIDYDLNSDTNHASIQLRIPNKFKVIQGNTLDIYLDNIVHVSNVQSLTFSFYLNGVKQTTYGGVVGQNRFISITVPEGRNKLQVDVSSGSGTASANAEILSFAASIPIGPVKVLTIGDSFTDGADFLRPLRTV